MPNLIFPVRHVPKNRQLWRKIRDGEIPWVHTPRWSWDVELSYQDVNGPHATLEARIGLAGVIDDGDYTIVVRNAAGGTLLSRTVTRNTTPADFAALASAIATEFDGEAAIAGHVASVDSDGDAVVFSGIEGAVFRVVVVAVPAGVDTTVTHDATIDLDPLGIGGPFPDNVLRSWCLLEVTTAFDVGTITVGDANEPAGILGSTPVDLTVPARTGSVAADAEYQPRPELSFAPIAVVALGDDPILRDGAAVLQILFKPNLSNSAT